MISYIRKPNITNILIHFIRLLHLLEILFAFIIVLLYFYCDKVK